MLFQLFLEVRPISGKLGYKHFNDTDGSEGIPQNVRELKLNLKYFEVRGLMCDLIFVLITFNTKSGFYLFNL